MDAMKVRQQDVEGVSHHVIDLRKTIKNLIAEASERLDQPTPIHRDAHYAVAGAAAMLSTAVQGLATLAVLLRWQTSITEAYVADEPHNTHDQVRVDIDEFLVSNAMQLDETLAGGGPFAHIYRQCVVNQAAEACANIDALMDAADRTEELCEKYGIDFEKVQDGDKDALRQVLAASGRAAGFEVPAEIYEALGLTAPGSGGGGAPPHSYSAADLAAHLGIDEAHFKPPHREDRRPDGIRA